MLGQIATEVKGLCPLIQHNPESMSVLPTGKKVDYNDAGYKKLEMESTQYRDEKGNLVQPADHFMAALVKAGARFKYEGRLSYASVVEGGVLIEPEMILHKKGTKVEKFERWVVVPPRTGARIRRVRPIIKDWSLSFTTNVMNDSINFETLKKIFEYAGSFIGIGNWRPRYGRFEVVKFGRIGK